MKALDLTLEQKQEIAETLRGTADIALEFRLQEQFSLDDDLEVGIAAEELGIRKCSSCCWWCEEDEMNEEDECQDCQDAEEE